MCIKSNHLLKTCHHCGLTLCRAIFFWSLCLFIVVPGFCVASQPPAAIEHCAYCHNDDGNTTSLDVPRIAGQPADYLAVQMLAYRNGSRWGRGMMDIAAARLTEHEIDTVAAYFAAQPVVSSNNGAGAQNAIGEQLYNRGKHGMPACIACHVPLGMHVPFDYPRVLGQNGFYLRQQLRAYRNGTRHTDNLAMMRDIAQQLSDGEIDAVSLYAARHRP